MFLKGLSVSCIFKCNAALGVTSARNPGAKINSKVSLCFGTINPDLNIYGQQAIPCPWMIFLLINIRTHSGFKSLLFAQKCQRAKASK